MLPEIYDTYNTGNSVLILMCKLISTRRRFTNRHGDDLDSQRRPSPTSLNLTFLHAFPHYGVHFLFFCIVFIHTCNFLALFLCCSRLCSVILSLTHHFSFCLLTKQVMFSFCCHSLFPSAPTAFFIQFFIRFLMRASVHFHLHNFILMMVLGTLPLRAESQP